MKIKTGVKKYRQHLFISCCILFCLPLLAQASDSRPPEVRIFSNKGNLENQFLAFGSDFSGGASIAVCDLEGDGVTEIIVGAGPNGGPQVRILSHEGIPKFTPGFFAYEINFRGGVNVACGDLDGNGTAEIITAPMSKGGPHIRIFNRYGIPIFTPGFFAYDTNMKGGVNLAVGDIDGGGIPEIITAPAAGDEPRVNIFNRYGIKLPFDVYPFHPDFSGGVSIATANVDDDYMDELILGVHSQDVGLVKVINVGASEPPIGEFKAFPDDYKQGVNVTSGDLDQDGYDEIIVAANSGGGPHVKAFKLNGTPLSSGFFSYENEFRGGVQIASDDVDRDGKTEIITTPRKKTSEGIVDRILVDLSEQRLYAYEDSILLRTFLVSTGLPGMDTQAGEFRISQKIYSKNYSGPGYYLPNTLWNMRFDGSRLLHGAYWHHNFGHRMSHGCVNIDYPDAEWLYNATPIWTLVRVQQ
ncbi:MAG: L,D-transpeptidase [Patescibacteria group bacterium]|nr:L,D-transpeptidase [Patescibacteria group bacterium]MDD5715089.1 L,D-transpeptidase [Patescibacteria group bacterium]